MGPVTQRTPPIRGEPIPGYQILERLGAGGYGEVWKALAPGAIEKAIKFVHGDFDDERAERELKALNRVKEVRHPFLLSLDRIEVVDGQLVIVTELADMSLKDRFRDCLHAGAVGISRDELIGYLHDAADALDYMSQRWSLQHLDVKPENLLLVGGRVKVADFGLVQNIQNVSVSLQGGLTPVYAPPELFEGRPGLRSDQYSLAIVYQEMLTGVLPFSGTTAAHLMTSHLRDRPRLSSLPTADRADIARALSKRPADRFPSCCALLDALRQRRSAAPRRSAVVQPQPRQADAQDVADAVRGHTCDGSSGEMSPSPTPCADVSSGCTSTLEFARSTVDTAPQAVEMPPVELDGGETEYRPSLFLAIGGTAAMTIRQLHRRLSERVGPLSRIPAFQTLLLDTDLQEIVRATQGEALSALQPSETVAMPLRNTQQYCQGTGKFLGWLSRRWLYNIPRSLQPEGRRPLGRLALVDHAEHVLERLRAALEMCTSQQSIDASSAATGCCFAAAPPRVYLVASLAGGTGSGMVVDMAYAVRELLGELGLSDRGVCGILMHSSSRDEDARDLAIANTYACLSELYHFSHPSLTYPGAPECGIRSFGEDDRTFPNAYFVDLGDRLSTAELKAATADVAEYLYRDAATPVGRLLDKCRAAEPFDPDSDPAFWLRSFGLRQFGIYETPLVVSLGDRICRDVVGRWRGDEQRDAPPPANGATSTEEGKTAEMPAEVRSPTSEDNGPFDCNENRIREGVAEVLAARFEGDFRHSLRSHVESLLGTGLHNAHPLTDAKELLTAAEALLDHPADHPGAATDTARNGRVWSDVDKFAERLELDVRRSLQEFLGAPQPRASLAVRAATRLASELQSFELRAAAECRLAQERTRQAAADVVASCADSGSPRWRMLGYFPHWRELATTAELLEQYVVLRFDESVTSGVCRVVQRFRCALTDELRSLSTLQSELNTLVRQLGDRVPRGGIRGDGDHGGRERRGQVRTGDLRNVTSSAPQREARGDDCVGGGAQSGMDVLAADHVLGVLQSRWPDLVNQFETQLVRDVLEPHGGLAGALATQSTFRLEAAATLRRTALTTVTRRLQEINVAEFLFHNVNAGKQDASEQLQDWLDAAVPRLVAGGARRLLLAVREGTEMSAPCAAIERATGQPCSVTFGSDGDVLFCYEVERIPLAGVLAHLIGRGTRHTDIAARLHTRIDVAWTPIAAPSSLPCGTAHEPIGML
jgi:serine/threonine protein kinase